MLSKLANLKNFPLVLSFIFVIPFAKSLISPSCWAATYYVDTKNGNDYKSGLSPKMPWKTIAKVNASRFNPGDQILLRRGLKWREQLTVPSSGSLGNPITFGSFGNKDNPIINGADLVTGWTQYPDNPNLWQVSSTASANQIFRNGRRCAAKTSVGNLNAECDWYLDESGGKLYFYSTTNPNNDIIEASHRTHGIVIDGKRYITIDGINIEKSNTHNVEIRNASTDVIIRNCTISNAYMRGVNSATGTFKRSNLQVLNSKVNYSGGSGIGFYDYTDSCTIGGNSVHDNCMFDVSDAIFTYSAGIHVGGQPTGPFNLTKTIIEYNMVYHNNPGGDGSNSRGKGIWVDTAGSGTIVRYNNIHDNGNNGLVVEATSGVKVYYNLVFSNFSGIILTNGITKKIINNNEVYNNVSYGNKGVGIWVQGMYPPEANSCSGNLIKNNISISNTSEQLRARYGGENDGSFGIENVYTNNSFGPEDKNFIMWGNGIYKSTYSAWEAAYGGSTNSVKSGPFFEDALNNKFSLKPNSPCVDAGTDVGLKRDYLGTAIPQGTAPDVGAFEYVYLVPPRNLRIAP